MNHRLGLSREADYGAERYDTVTIWFHWLTALLVVLLFGTTFIWNYITPHDRYWRPLLEDTHVSLGILFGAVVLGRIAWRLIGRPRPSPVPGLTGTLSHVVHGALYLLLVLQVVLGFVLRWFQGEDFSFFGLFSVPAIIGQDKALAHSVQEVHNLVGWTIVILAIGHAAAALYHHYVLKDRLVRRMRLA